MKYENGEGLVPMLDQMGGTKIKWNVISLHTQP